MPDTEGHRVAREARADLARRATGSSLHTGEMTTTHMVNAAVYRYEHREQGNHPALPEGTDVSPPD